MEPCIAAAGLCFPRLLALIGLALCLLACDGAGTASGGESDTPVCSGHVLFGRPVPSTGLSEEQCQPRCTCGGEAWEAPEPTEEQIAGLLLWQIVEPPEPLDGNPYDGPDLPEATPGEVCAVVHAPPGPRSYRLETYPSAEAAALAGATVTHSGACGLCSPLADLAVYMRYPDLTAPVRDCGLANLTGTEQSHVQCLQDLGFDLPCAQIWYYNTIHTGQLCAGPCFSAIGDPYHFPDGSLNDCLQCDEDKSGPVFKAVAGRTRRNTGLASALCRPCEEVQRLWHDYP
jgi:hypothetical protein